MNRTKLLTKHPSTKYLNNDGLVVLPLKEYKHLLISAVPVYYLKERAAKKIDRLVKDGLKAYQDGKTKIISSLADLD